MAQDRDQKTATLSPDLDDTQLLGFETLPAKSEAETGTEQAIGLAFNKRGLAEGGEPSNG
jgi:hypothetical protein